MSWQDIVVGRRAVGVAIVAAGVLLAAACSGRFKAVEVDTQVDKPSGSSSSSRPPSPPGQQLPRE